MNDEQDDSKYETGYKKPPITTRFRKGRSGNPKGRPKDGQNLSTMFHSIAGELITITEGGKARRIPKIEGVVRQLMAKGLTGDHRAMTEVVRLYLGLAEISNSSVSSAPDREKDNLVMTALMKRLHTFRINEELAPAEETNEAPRSSQ